MPAHAAAVACAGADALPCAGPTKVQSRSASAGRCKKCRCELGVGAGLQDCDCSADTDHSVHAGRCSAVLRGASEAEAAHD